MLTPCLAIKARSAYSAVDSMHCVGKNKLSVDTPDQLANVEARMVWSISSHFSLL